MVRKWLRLSGLALVVEGLEACGLRKVLLFRLRALGLGLFDQFERALEVAGQTLIIDGQIGEFLGVLLKCERRSTGGGRPGLRPC